MKNTYYFVEMPSFKSTRKADKIEANSLVSAKRMATNRQMNDGNTVLVIGDHINKWGFIDHIISTKDSRFALNPIWDNDVRWVNEEVKSEIN